MKESKFSAPGCSLRRRKRPATGCSTQSARPGERMSSNAVSSILYSSCARKNALIVPSFSSGENVQVEYTSTPPGFTVFAASSKIHACLSAHIRTASGLHSFLAASSLRNIPSPEQGASTKTRSKKASLEGIKVLRPGLQLATEKKNRFEPAHALALTLLPGDSSRMYGLTGQEAAAYLRGESIACGAEKGWTALFYEGYALGFGKASGGQMKNHYPKGLRKSL